MTTPAIPTPAQIAELRRLCEAATSAPWQWEFGTEGQVTYHPRPDCTQSVSSGFDLDADCALVCEMRSALPSLLAAAERLAEVEARLKKAVADIDERVERCGCEPESFCESFGCATLVGVREILAAEQAAKAQAKEADRGGHE